MFPFDDVIMYLARVIAPSCWEFTCNLFNPRLKTDDIDNVSKSWRHHEIFYLHNGIDHKVQKRLYW